MRDKQQENRVRQRRMDDALRQREEIQDRASFDLITLRTSDKQRHWQFYFQERFLLSYWPAVAKAKRADQADSQTCTSPARALRLAQQMRREMEAPTKPPEGSA